MLITLYKSAVQSEPCTCPLEGTNLALDSLLFCPFPAGLPAALYMFGTLLRLIEFFLRSTFLVSGALFCVLILAPKLEVAGARSLSDTWLDERNEGRDLISDGDESLLLRLVGEVYYLSSLDKPNFPPVLPWTPTVVGRRGSAPLMELYCLVS